MYDFSIESYCGVLSSGTAYHPYKVVITIEFMDMKSLFERSKSQRMHKSNL